MTVMLCRLLVDRLIEATGTRIIRETHFSNYTYLDLANGATITICREGTVVLEARPPNSFITKFREFGARPGKTIKRSSSRYDFEFDGFDF